MKQKKLFPEQLLHGRSDSNARHLVLETSALPTELHPCFLRDANIVISSKIPKKNNFFTTRKDISS